MLASAWLLYWRSPGGGGGMLSSPLTTSRRSRNRSSGFSVGVNSNAEPSAAGNHCPGMTPFGTYTAPNRIAGRAAVCSSAVSAGTIASRNGSGIAAPIVRSIVRRDKAFLVIIMRRLSPSGTVCC